MDSLAGSLNTRISLSQGPLSLGAGKAKKTEDNPSEAMGSFGQMLKNQIEQINQLQVDADSAVNTYAVGGDIELHNVIMATSKAEMSLQLATQIRNKLLMAYQDIIKMPI